MSYYDHATLMAHRLGAWADDPAKAGGSLLPHGRTGRCKSIRDGIRQALGRILPRLRNKPQPQKPVPEPDRGGRDHPIRSTDGDAPRKSW